MYIITHRGLDPSTPDFPFESSREAFEAHLSRGYGIEFDPQRTADGYIVLHDATLKRITGGADEREVLNIPTDDILKLNLHGSHFAALDEVLAMIARRGILSAIHLKHSFQSDKKNLDALVEVLLSYNPELFILFDTTIETASYLKEKNAALHLAPSIAHPYDIERFGAAVGRTLLPLDEALARRGLFDWAWLDEWDLADRGGAQKKFYTKEVFETLRAAGFKIALVTPELHGTSPGLLGSESHPDAKSIETLQRRLEEIVVLRPDAICTDYPDLVKRLVEKELV